MKRSRVIAFNENGSLGKESSCWDWALMETIIDDYTKQNMSEKEAEYQFWQDIKDANYEKDFPYKPMSDEHIKALENGECDEIRAEYLNNLNYPYIIINDKEKIIGTVGTITDVEKENVIKYAKQIGYCIHFDVVDDGD